MPASGFSPVQSALYSTTYHTEHADIHPISDVTGNTILHLFEARKWDLPRKSYVLLLVTSTCLEQTHEAASYPRVDQYICISPVGSPVDAVADRGKIIHTHSEQEIAFGIWIPGMTQNHFLC